jgi:dipeptidyl aminopeptidase/acylaminoacyl peptidase
MLVATDESSKISRVIWDPNPQLKGIELSDVSVFRWKDQAGLNWVGGLYKPIGYVRGRAYPLVIQTHGFHENQFEASGVFPTGFAAQQLAAAGFVVLQVRDCRGRSTPQEGQCNVAGYEAAVVKLAEEGIVDLERIGIVGFSRTCYYVMEALTIGNIHFKAASITDGVNEGYLQYITSVDDSDNALAREADAMNGAAPFGKGLHEWLEKSPEFNADRVNTPLQVVAAGRAGVLFMWEPYAALRYLNRPVDLVILNTSEHVLTNPKARIVSQGGTVDWFRFWLKDEEDTDPAKVRQYARWRRLRTRAMNN